MIKTVQEVERMLQKFDDAADEGELDCDGEAIRDALLWFLGRGRSDSDMEEYLEDM